LRIVGLAPVLLSAGTRDQTELRERFRSILAEARADQGVVLFIHDIHRVLAPVTEEGGLGLAELLVPALRAGKVRSIGTTTAGEYRRYVEDAPGLEDLFQCIFVDEPTTEESREILLQARSTFELHHAVTFTDDAIDAALEYAVKYVPERYLPSKALDLLDQAAVARGFATLTPGPLSSLAPEVGREDIAKVVANMKKL